MTKTSIFGQPEVKQEEKKPIDFVSKLTEKGELTTTIACPALWKNIVLMTKNYTTCYDLMWAYDDSPNLGTLYLGHWNDGIVK